MPVPRAEMSSPLANHLIVQIPLRIRHRNPNRAIGLQPLLQGCARHIQQWLLAGSLGCIQIGQGWISAVGKTPMGCYPLPQQLVTLLPMLLLP